ncbi:MAG: PD40 domain-containing protein [Candidatus Eisenbacteria bacterium]|nr:PD40 domain-containing protein [Candidatus Eisenbacteria bacterium]
MSKFARSIVRAAGVVMALALVVPAPAVAVERGLWMRYPSISPDGHSIAFSYKGNLWKVAATGGIATALTVGASHNTMPVWSPDGSKIAFASDRDGNFDVFVMPSEGGEATRLTFHSSDETPTSFAPDGRSVLFTASVLDAASNAQFPSPAQPELYRVGLDGGMPVQVLTTPALYAAFDRTGRRLAYSDQRGFEMEWRKHDHSAFARDVWLWDVAANRHTRLTEFGNDNRQPVWGPDGNSLFFLSERSGSFNVWKLDLANPKTPVQVTSHRTHPVRFLSASNGGDLCYAFDGELWVRPAATGEPRKLEVLIAADRRDRETASVDVTAQISEFEVSPDGGEIAFIARGEVFVASTEHGTTRRITNTPEQERSVSFSPDGRSLIYASERGSSWKLYRTDLTDKDEPNFFNATAFKETPVLEAETEAFQPRFSPDGQEVAYLEERTTLKVLNLKTRAIRTILPGDMNYSYIDGDQWFEWSPDGKWFAVNFLSPTRWSSEVGLIPSSGTGKLVNVTHSGYEDEQPRFARKGEVLFWRTDRNGLRSHANQGREMDVYAAFLTTRAWDRFRLDEAAFDQLKAKEKDQDKGKPAVATSAKGKASAEPAGPKAAEPVAIEFGNLDDRIVRLSLNSASLGGAALSPDGEKLYYLARFEKGFDLWRYTPREKEAKLVAKLGADDAAFELDKDGKKAFVLANGRLSTVDLESGKSTPVAASARMDLDASAERAYMFEHVWRQTLKKFHDPAMHGVDWVAMKRTYARFLPAIDNSRDFADLISEMQGELNASHSGGRYRPMRTDGDQTAALGFFPDPKHAGDGVGILEVLEGGPLQQSGSRIAAGVVLEAIDGAPIPAGSNWYRLLNRKADTRVRLALRDPRSGARWDETVTPISWGAQSRLLYLRWLKQRRELVERLSGGRLGYAHIRGMNDGAYREMYEEVFGRSADKEAIVLDTRFNGGGNLVEALTVFLSGKEYARNAPRGRQIGSEPSNRWTKPSIVVMSEGNYSDAHCFPMAYTQLGLGQTVGMPVPGTCTSVWWERLQNRDLVFGIPEVSLIDMAGDVMENKQLEPDYEVEPDPALWAAGRDQQLEKAVEVLLAKLPKK